MPTRKSRDRVRRVIGTRAERWLYRTMVTSSITMTVSSFLHWCAGLFP